MRADQGNCYNLGNTTGIWLTWFLAAKTDHEKTVLERQISATDRQIDELVYELYGLTAEEIKIVEKSVAR